MIHYIEGDLLSANAQALVNTVNTVGAMGKGIALQFKEMFPNNFHIYSLACKDKEMKPGKMLVVKERILGDEKIIINFPTKKDWKFKSKYEYIEDGLKDLVQVIVDYNIKSIAIPPLGCGNGGLEWTKVRDLIEQYLGEIKGVEFLIFEPNSYIKEILKEQDSNKQIKLTPARALLLYAMFYYESFGENSSLFVANKLAYLLQRLGETSFKKLKFEANYYGPYSVQVGHLVHSLNGPYLKGLEQMELTAFEPIELQYTRMNEISEYVKKELKEEQRERLKKLISIINGYESAFALEILSTVDFIRKQNPAIDKEDTLKIIQQWSERKKNLFKDEYVFIAYNHLEKHANKFELS